MLAPATDNVKSKDGMSATQQPLIKTRSKLVLPPPPSASHVDGILRQSDISLPQRVIGHSYIYQLLDPIAGEPRYVGVTKRAPRERLYAHTQANKTQRQPVCHWWRSVLAQTNGLPPVMRVIDGPILDDVFANPAGRLEIAWAEAHEAAGIELVNAVRCGARRSISCERWTPQFAQEEALLLLSGFTPGEKYPPRSFFQNHGHLGLHHFLTSLPDGHARVAEKLGLVLTYREWTHETAETEILALDLGKQYPTPAQFEAAGLAGLCESIRKWPGGHRAFSSVLGLTMVKREPWNAATASTATLSICTDLGLGDTYPTYQQFKETGNSGLYAFVLRTQPGGHRTFATSLQLKMLQPPPRTASSAREEAITFLAERGSDSLVFPGKQEFIDAGLNGLSQFIQNKLPGGHRAFAASLGMSMSRELWNVDKAEEQVRRLNTNLDLGDRYPLWRHFNDAELDGLFQFIHDKIPGGHPHLASALGLNRPLAGTRRKNRRSSAGTRIRE
jgi:hypothetical protein